ncbi:MAG: hypothetical protein P6D49_09895 [Acidimicrobiales bacterium]|nr:hypothetical protein [Acidimicrobiales bacterium]
MHLLESHVCDRWTAPTGDPWPIRHAVTGEPVAAVSSEGIDRLRFAKPTYPGDTLSVHLTCRRKTLRAGTGYGQVAWDSEVVNQDGQVAWDSEVVKQRGEVAAAHDVLTMVDADPA